MLAQLYYQHCGTYCTKHCIKFTQNHSYFLRSVITGDSNFRRNLSWTHLNLADNLVLLTNCGFAMVSMFLQPVSVNKCWKRNREKKQNEWVTERIVRNNARAEKWRFLVCKWGQMEEKHIKLSRISTGFNRFKFSFLKTSCSGILCVEA